MIHDIRRVFAAGLFGLAALSATPSMAAGLASYENVFTVTTTFDVGGAAVYAQPASDTGISGAQIGVGAPIPAGTSVFTHRPYFFSDVPLNTPSVTTIYGLTTLDPEVSIYDLSDPTALHLVVSLANGFATSILGESFSDAFAGFTSIDYADPLDEQNYINELLYISGLDQQYGLPSSPYGGPQTNLLFNFGSYLNAQGASLASGESFQMVAFSTATSIGTGYVSQNILSGAVPEPTTWAMLLIGFGMLGCMARRNRRCLST